MGLPVRGVGELAAREISDSFYGTYNSKTGISFFEPDSIELYEAGPAVKYEGFDGNELTERPSVYFDEYLSKKDKYSFFLGPVKQVVTVHTASDSGKSLVIFKDSYAHCLAPMLFADYGRITLVDLRWYKSDDYGADLELESFDDVLFLYSADIFAHQQGAGMLSVGS
jgi:hypothetical protein